jgi:hypothetical protein
MKITDIFEDSDKLNAFGDDPKDAAALALRIARDPYADGVEDDKNNPHRKAAAAYSKVQDKLTKVIVAGESDGAEMENSPEHGDWYDDATKRMEEMLENGSNWHEVINHLAREFQENQDGSFDAFQFAFDALSKRAWEMGFMEKDHSEEENPEPQEDENEVEKIEVEPETDDIGPIEPVETGDQMGWEDLYGDCYEGKVLDVDGDSALCEAADGQVYLVQIAKYITEDIAQILKRSGYLVETVSEAGTADKAGYKSKKGGLTAKGRAHFNRKDGSHLKAPQPHGGSRKKSYCARSAGINKRFHIDCRKTPNARNCLARRRWKC